jgi:hypothetical protein
MSTEKITKALARRLAQSKGNPVSGVVFAAIETEKLPLTSFAARAAARDQEVQQKLSRVMARVRAWESSSGQSATVAVRPDAAAVAVTAPPALFEALAEDDAVRAIDVEARQ